MGGGELLLRPVVTRRHLKPHAPTDLPPAHPEGLAHCPAGHPGYGLAFLFSPTEQTQPRLPTAGRGRVVQGAWAKAAPQDHVMGVWVLGGRPRSKGEPTCHPICARLPAA